LYLEINHLQCLSTPIEVCPCQNRGTASLAEAQTSLTGRKGLLVCPSAVCLRAENP
jgi:hypothetical protein